MADMVHAALAAELFARYGDDFDTANAVHRSTNPVWLGSKLAVKIGKQPGRDWRREIGLARAMPVEVGHPRIVAAGVTDHFPWIVTERLSGMNLEDAWPDMAAEDRVRSIRQMWDRLLTAHRTDPAVAVECAGRESKFYPAAPVDTVAALDRVAATGLLRENAVAALCERLDRHWAARGDAPYVLNHGDFWTCNAPWDGHDDTRAVIVPARQLLDVAEAGP